MTPLLPFSKLILILDLSTSPFENLRVTKKSPVMLRLSKHDFTTPFSKLILIAG